MFLFFKDRGEENNDTKDKIDGISKINEGVKSLLNFKEDEFVELIRAYKNKIIFDKDTNSFDLSEFVFGSLKSLLKDKWKDYVEHPDFVKILSKELKLEGDYSLVYDTEEIYKLISITNSKRHAGVKPKDANGFVFHILGLENQDQIEGFLDKIIEGSSIKKHIGKHTGEGYDMFIVEIIAEAINKKIISKKESGIYVSEISNNKDGDLNIAEICASKLFRDNFYYCNRVLGYDLLSGVTNIIPNDLLFKTKNLENGVNGSIDEIELFVLNLQKNEGDNRSILDIKSKFNMSVFNDYLSIIMRDFFILHDVKINNGLLEGIIERMIISKNLNINTGKLFKSISILFENNISELVTLFSKYDNKTISENGKKYKYGRFHIRDLNNLYEEYSIEKLFGDIKLIIEEEKEVYIEIDKKNEELEKNKCDKYQYGGGHIENLKKREEELGGKIKKLIEPLNEDEKRLKIKLIRDINNIMKGKDNFITECNVLNINEIKIRERIADLELRHKNLLSKLKRIEEDFIRTMLFSRKEVN